MAQDARAHGVPLPDGPIFLLTHLRYLGYCFNPISFYFCYDRSGHLDTVLAEVNSTFGESRNYWLSSQNRQPSANALHYRCPKTHARVAVHGHESGLRIRAHRAGR